VTAALRPSRMAARAATADMPPLPLPGPTAAAQAAGAAAAHNPLAGNGTTMVNSGMLQGVVRDCADLSVVACVPVCAHTFFIDSGS
jgi:hypothetical protein